MAGVYIHIPFCKQACYYCDFHFSTSLKKKNELISCLIKEIEIRKYELNGEVIETIYFGGGTPSLLDGKELKSILAKIMHFRENDPQKVSNSIGFIGVFALEPKNS